MEKSQFQHKNCQRYQQGRKKNCNRYSATDENCKTTQLVCVLGTKLS